MTLTTPAWICCGLLLFTASSAGAAQNFSAGPQPAARFGVHEIVLTGNGDLPNPFDTIVRVAFTPPSGEPNARTVWAFYDGGHTWRARVYAAETGDWSWTSACETDPALHGQRGRFHCAASTLRGRMLIHPRNPRQWMTEDGRWFLNLNDTSYFLLCAHDGDGQPIPDDDVRDYLRDAQDRGITSFRSFIGNGAQSFLGERGSDRHRWNDLFADAEFSRPNLDHLRIADHRLRLMLDEFPDAYIQVILFPLGKPWRADERFWQTLRPEQRDRILRYLIARFAAYPQVFWLIVNDAYFGPVTYKPNPQPNDPHPEPRTIEFPNSCAMVREVGRFFQQHDPWQHPISAGPARGAAFHFDQENWATYVHLEADYDVAALRSAEHHPLAKPVFLGEDRYEHDHPGSYDPVDMRYFQRRMFWSWLLAGGSANYGGRWWVLHPYAQTGSRPARSIHHPDHTYTAKLTGLDSARVIRDYFESRGIELSDFVPDQALVSDPDVNTPEAAPKLSRRGWEEFLIYHPNARGQKRSMQSNPTHTPQLRLDLRQAAGEFQVEWCRAIDGETLMAPVAQAGSEVELKSPWPGQDLVLRLKRVVPQ